MNKVAILIPCDGKFAVVNEEFHVARIPAIGEKILIEESTADSLSTTLVYEVVDVHYDRHGNTDIFAVKVNTNETYKHTLDKTIVK